PGDRVDVREHRVAEHDHGRKQEEARLLASEGDIMSRPARRTNQWCERDRLEPETDQERRGRSDERPRHPESEPHEEEADDQPRGGLDDEVTAQPAESSE